VGIRKPPQEKPRNEVLFVSGFGVGHALSTGCALSCSTLIRLSLFGRVREHAHDISPSHTSLDHGTQDALPSPIL
jgi:hypothetical protein